MKSPEECITKGAFRLPPDSELITDADEEVFYLYSNLQRNGSSSSSDFRGLGHVDSRKDTLSLKFELKGSANATNGNPRIRSSRKNRSGNLSTANDKTVEIELAQDKTALRSRKGDTGSVLWKASIDFAQSILQQAHTKLESNLVDPEVLKSQHLLELGSGTGMLSIALSPLVRHYTATEIPELLPLIRKNININFGSSESNVSVEELDWEALLSSTASQRLKNFVFSPADIILVVDCIYHPSLLPSLVETIDFLSIPNHTIVIVVSELRAEDVIRDFLDLWINKPDWKIWHVGGEGIGKPYVTWLGWKDSMESKSS